MGSAVSLLDGDFLEDVLLVAGDLGLEGDLGVFFADSLGLYKYLYNI